MSTLSTGVPRELVVWLQQKYNLREFIETGTFRGDSAEFALSLFDYVLTIELDEDNYNHSKKRLEEVVRTLTLDTERTTEIVLDCWRGDSGELMPGALKQLDGSALIWLDAHCVAGQFGDEDSCPVLEELEAIVLDPYKHIILIDDAHCFHPPLPAHLTPEAWPTIDDIRRVAAKGNYEVHVAHDLIILDVPAEMPSIIAFIATLAPARHALMKRMTCVATAVNGPMKKGAVPAALPAFTGLVYTNYGWMLVHRFDPNQTPALSQAGISRDHQDIEMLGKYLKDAGYGSVFVDIGANIGAYSFGLRRFCSEVHSFEPQRILYNMMCGSIALNGWLNVYCYNAAVGGEMGRINVPQFDYNKPLSFGSIEFGPEQVEPLAQQRQYSSHKQEQVLLTTLDNCNFKRIDVLKIDVEGMEADVLAGAHETIARCRPVILIEHGKSHKGILRTILESMGYAVEESGVFDFLCVPIA